MAEKKYDVVIIGAGPNGLAMGAYLSRAGLKVLLLEKRHEAGGGLATEEVTLPDYIHNTHAVYMMMVDYAPIYTDLKLEEEYGVKHIHPSLQFALPLSDGKCLCLYSDPERTCNSIARFSKRDADSYRELYHTAKRIVDGFIAPATYVPPEPALDQLVRIQQTEVGREIAEFSEKTPREIVDEYFENEHVKALMLYLATHWGVGYDEGGMGYLPILYINRASNYRLVAGGSHMAAQALHKVVHESGSTVWTNQRLKRIIIDGGVAKGVELEDGTVVYADKAVVSTIDPPQTFLKLVGRENLGEDFAEKIEGWMWEKYTIMGLHLALEEAPNFAAAAADPEINQAFIYILGYETPEELIKDYDAIYGGELPSKANYNCCFPSVHDPLQAAPGRHTGLLSRFAPYRLKEGAEKWYNLKFKEEVAEQYLVTLQRYAPNMTRDKVLWHYISTPIDVENKYLDMVEGSYKQGLYHPFQMGYLRPNEECSQYRTPVKNLYLAGSCCYPGGCVLWGAGYVATNTLAEDLGIEKWWSEPEMITRARGEGLL
jgi:phytoene dehydrogenase-like protein